MIKDKNLSKYNQAKILKEKLADKGITADQKDCEKILNACCETIAEVLAQGTKFTSKGLFSLYLEDIKAREMKTIYRKGETLQDSINAKREPQAYKVPAKKRLKVRISDSLNRKINPHLYEGRILSDSFKKLRTSNK